jgi:hypothetical protein
MVTTIGRFSTAIVDNYVGKCWSPDETPAAQLPLDGLPDLSAAEKSNFQNLTILRV